MNSVVSVLVENNEFDNPGGDYFIKERIETLLSADPKIDTIVLGCTHYPILMDKIKQFVPKGITILAQGEIVATQLVDYLKRHPEMDSRCSKNGTIKYFTSEHPESFNSKAGLFISRDVVAEHIVIQHIE